MALDTLEKDNLEVHQDYNLKHITVRASESQLKKDLHRHLERNKNYTLHEHLTMCLIMQV